MMTYSSSRGRPLLCERESGEQRGQILSRKRPFERARSSVVVVLKAEQCGLKSGEISEIARGQHLALDDREIDLDLIQPTGVNGGEHGNQRGPLTLKPLDRFYP